MSLNNEADENDKIVAHPSPSTLYYRILTVNMNRRDPNTKWKTQKTKLSDQPCICC